MASADYRIESNHPVINRLLPRSEIQQVFTDPSLAVAIAAKCVPNPFGDEVRVVHVPSGEVIFLAVPAAPKPDEGS
ncbi:MAG: hypothetical protein ACREXG_12590 [Polaromonas sp.]